MINFPPATADGQIFSYNYTSWIWDQSKTRWNVLQSALPTPVPIEFGGTGSSTISGAKVNLGISGGTTNLTFDTLEQAASGISQNSFINPDLFVKLNLSPAIRYINPSFLTSTGISGVGASTNTIVNALGGVLNYPSTRGFAWRAAGGVNLNQLLSRVTGPSVDFTKTVIFSGRFRLGSTTSFPASNQFFRAVMGTSSTDSIGNSNFRNDSAGIIRYGMGIRVDGLGPVQLITRNGTTATEASVSANVFFASNIPVDFMIFNRNGNTSLFINNVFVVSSSTGPRVLGLNVPAGLEVLVFTSSPSTSSQAYYGNLHLYTE
jgi:hypothetical protein